MHGTWFGLLTIDLSETSAQPVKLVNRIKKFEFRSSFQTWLHRVSVNGTIDFLKKLRRKSAVSFEEMSSELNFFASDADSPMFGLEQEETKAEVWQVLASMTDKFRLVLVLREMEDFSYEEIAGVLDCPIGTVESRLFRAREMFKKKHGLMMLKRGKNERM